MPKKAKTETDDFAALKGVEIMRVGTWNGIPITEADLDAMIDAFPNAEIRPPLKLDKGEGRKTHADGGPAFGWVTSLRRDGDKLVADFEDVDDALVPLIQKRNFDTVSAEIIPNFERNGKRFKRVLKAVELMGASLPAVGGLKPVSASLGFSGEDEWFVERIVSEGEPQMAKDKDTPKGDSEVEALKAKLAAAEQKFADAQAEIEKAKADKPTPQSFQDTTEYKAMADKIAKLEEQRRQDWITQAVADCKIPSFRRHVHLFADLASGQSEERVYKFKETGKDGVEKERDVTARDAVLSLVRDLNAQAAILFRDTAVSTHPDRPENVEEPPKDSFDAGTKLDSIAQKYLLDKKVESYADAIALARKDNPDLAKLEAQG